MLLDNGHGYDTPGKRSPDGRLQEWSWNRKMVERVEQGLWQRGIYTIQLVKEDVDVPLAERAARARREAEGATARGQKPVLVAIHVNAAGAEGKWLNARGWQVHISKSPKANFPSVAQRIKDESDRLARRFAEAATAGGFKLRSEHAGQPYWRSNLFILNYCECPAVLTENLFMDSREDIELLLSEKGQEALAKLHIDALSAYASRK